MKKRYLATAYALAASFTFTGVVAVGIDKHNARTGVDIDLTNKEYFGGVYGAFDYKPTKEELVLINQNNKQQPR